MKKFIQLLLSGLLLLTCSQMQAQTNNCTTVLADGQTQGQVFFNYGSVSNAENVSFQSNFTIGQMVVGSYSNGVRKGNFGFWGRYLLPPAAPSVSASEGNLADRIEINWTPDPLSPKASSYKLYRDGALLAQFDNETFSYIDFNVTAGNFYEYSVVPRNSLGVGSPGKALGFLNPNGVVTGRVTTQSGNPVYGAIVTLEPSLGSALQFDGVDDMAFIEDDSTLRSNVFTLSCWVKLASGNDSTAILDYGSNANKNWWLHTLPSASGTGVKFSIGNGTGSTAVSHVFPAGNANEWHFVAASSNGSALLFYVDGELVETKNATLSSDSTRLFLGQDPIGNKRFSGSIDELRMFNKQLSQTELQMFMNRTVSLNTPGLTGYWKMDEGTGRKSFGQATGRRTMFLCGPTWSSSRPDVVNAGVTNASGYYGIAGVNYGPGTTFTAKASKNSYFNQSLEFNGANQHYANLTNFDLPDSSTILLTVKPFDFSGSQTILSKADGSGSDLFSVHLNSGNLVMTVNGTSHDFGALSMGFHHLAFTLAQSGSSLTVNFYKEGASVASHTFSGAATDLSGLPWKVGAKASGTSSHSNFFTGLVDEVAFFNSLLSANDIAACANTGIDGTHFNLTSFFPMNEGAGPTLTDMGPAMTGNGTRHGATWSTVSAVIDVLPHEFNPSTRLVSLNPSNTSADNVDFLDKSTIPVSGYVRFDGTTCFQQGTEILVNGEPFVPAIKTDANGKFVADFEPSFSGTLTPKMEGHTFLPAKWDITALNSPVAGILFRNQTKRQVKGQMAGGDCRLSVIPGNAIVKVKVETLDGCFYREKTLTGDGKFTFEGVPPDSVTVAVTQHSNNVIYTYFQNQGGFTSDLRMANDTVDFIYFAPPNVELSALDTNSCGQPMVNMLAGKTVDIKVYEDYDGGRCYLDSALLTINNEIAHLEQFDTMMSGGLLKHKFRVEDPNIVAPYLKTLQVTAEVKNQQNSASLNTVILGRRPRTSTFSSKSPEIPTLILRDPPGDASYAYIESGETTCQSWSFGGTDAMDHEENITISLGPDFESSAGTPFFSVGTEIDATADFGYTHTGTTTAYTSNEMETCLTATKTISTGDNDLIVGSEMGGDLFMGGAINFIYGITDELLWDTLNCEFYLDQGLYMSPDTFATTFIYTEYHIENNVIPTLELVGDTTSANMWRSILAKNDTLKMQATFAQNISFDGGVTYEESQTTQVSKSINFSWEQEFSNGFSVDLGLTANGVGAVGGIAMNWTIGESNGNGSTTDSTRTVGFVLADDDIGDNFTVNVKKDKVYGTPVFDLVAGQSQCPHEPMTQPREGVAMEANKLVAVNVPMNEKAIFELTLGNVSQSGELKAYTLEADPSTTNGVNVRFNGLPSLDVQVPFGEGVPVTMTVERIANAFDFEDISVEFFSACEDERAIALGQYLEDENFVKELVFDVHFLEPCSPVDISFPMEGWVVIPTDGNILNITLVDYDEEDPELELIRVQYRRFNGDGAWINIAEIQKADLGPVFTIQTWDTQGLQDGEYEIRAVTQCIGGENPGISHIIKGKFERTPPEIFGTPEPADGVLSPGDEISITFSEAIRCNLLLQADVFQNNNVGLYDTGTGDLIDAVITCLGNKISIVPNVPNQFIENKILRVQVDSVQDLAGNKFGTTSWEFFVDRNPLRWVGGELESFKYEDETQTVYKTILNTGGTSQQYELVDVPDWVTVYPTTGLLAPGQQQVITFVFDENMVTGMFADTLFMNGAAGNEPLYIDFRNLCRSPQWEVNPAGYSYSMNFTVQLDIEGELSTDNMDIVAAFIDDELRGTAYLQYVPAVSKYVAFLTVYSNIFDSGEVTFQIWDADQCLLFSPIQETFTFTGDELNGTPIAPVVLHTDNLLLRKIPIHAGWNWLSFNLAFPSTDLDTALATLSHPQGDLVKNQSQFAEYNDGFDLWLGSLFDLGNTSMYQYRADQADTLDMIGHPIDPTMQIPLVAGWNWVGYLPQNPMPIANALASLHPTDGDLIKSQTAFAQYVAGFGWLGNLDYLKPTEGYLLKLAAVDSLSYPHGIVGGGVEENRSPEALAKSPWTVNPAEFEHTMILVGQLVASNDTDLTAEGQVIAAFAPDGGVRGVTPALYVEPLNAWLFFMTTYANQSGEMLSFQLFDEVTETSTELTETMPFAIDHQAGSVEAPTPFVLENATATTESRSLDNRLVVRPNPVEGVAEILFRSAHFGEAEITVTDALGQLASHSQVAVRHGWNSYLWNAEGLSAGVYFVKVELPGVQLTSRVVVR